MKSVLENRFDKEDRFKIENIHETVHRQYLGFRKAKRDVPEWSPEYDKRKRHNKKWQYVNGEFCEWLTQLDQKTIVGHKLNEKIDEIIEQGKQDNWELY